MRTFVTWTFRALFWSGFLALAWNTFMPEHLVWIELSPAVVVSALIILVFLAGMIVSAKEWDD